MVILFPLAVPLAESLAPNNDDIMISTIGGILAGSIFGDHCSPSIHSHFFLIFFFVHLNLPIFFDFFYQSIVVLITNTTILLTMIKKLILKYFMFNFHYYIFLKTII